MDLQEHHRPGGARRGYPIHCNNSMVRGWNRCRTSVRSDCFQPVSIPPRGYIPAWSSGHSIPHTGPFQVLAQVPPSGHPCDTTSLHHDLADILGIYGGLDTPEVIAGMRSIVPGFTHAHSQWTSNALLHLSWTSRSVPGSFNSIRCYTDQRDSVNRDAQSLPDASSSAGLSRKRW